MAEEKYVCTLDEFSLKVAKDELGEDPKERESQVETFRKWILDQPHLTAPTDTLFLLKYLRTAKFSQLRAREILQGTLRIKNENPEWLNDIDTADTKIHEFMRTCLMVPIPDRLPDSRRLYMVDEGAFNADLKRFDVASAVRAMMAMIYYTNLEEQEVVHGVVMFDDFSKFSMKHFTFWGLENMKKLTALFEGNLPGRYKGIHVFNPGPLFETVMSAMKPFMSKKLQNRFYVHGKNMEDIYKIIPKQYFPDEYLPDDYKGERQGSMKEIIEKIITEMKKPEIRERILYETSSRWTFDEKKKVTDDEPSASFRKLNVD